MSDNVRRYSAINEFTLTEERISPSLMEYLAGKLEEDYWEESEEAGQIFINDCRGLALSQIDRLDMENYSGFEWIDITKDGKTFILCDVCCEDFYMYIITKGQWDQWYKQFDISTRIIAEEFVVGYMRAGLRWDICYGYAGKEDYDY